MLGRKDNELSVEHKELIDNMSYAEMLRLWRFEPTGSVLFIGEAGEYFRKVLAEKEAACENVAAVSKLVGWNQ